MPKLTKFRKLFPIKQNIAYNFNINELYNLSNNEFDKILYVMHTDSDVPYKVIKLFREIDRLRNIKMIKKSTLDNIQIAYDNDED